MIKVATTIGQNCFVITAALCVKDLDVVYMQSCPANAQCTKGQPVRVQDALTADFGNALQVVASNSTKVLFMLAEHSPSSITLSLAAGAAYSPASSSVWNCAQADHVIMASLCLGPRCQAIQKMRRKSAV